MSVVVVVVVVVVVAVIIIIIIIISRDTTNVEPEMYYYTSNNWNHWNSNEKLQEKFGSSTRKTNDRFLYKRQLCSEHHI